MKSFLLAAATLASSAYALSVMDKIIAAKNAITQVTRINALDDSDFVFDFLHPVTGESTGAAGHSVAASASNFPGIIGNGMAMTIGFLDACGLNSPHTHPRATEFNFAVNGTLVAGMLAENGARYVFNEVPPGSATIFPKGAIHFEMNNDCEPMIFVAAFNNEDPGVLQVAQRFFGITPSFVAASFGDLGVEEVASLEAMIPDNIALGVDECLQRCGITRTTQPTKQRQQRVASNALPQGFSGPPAPAPTPSMSSPAMAYPSPSSGYTYPPAPAPVAPSTDKASFLSKNAAVASSGSTSSLTSQPAFIALIVIVVLMAVGYLGLAIMMFRRNGNSTKGWSSLAGREIRARGGMMEEKPLPSAADYSLHEERYDPHPAGDHKE